MLFGKTFDRIQRQVPRVKFARNLRELCFCDLLDGIIWASSPVSFTTVRVPKWVPSTRSNGVSTKLFYVDAFWLIVSLYLQPDGLPVRLRVQFIFLPISPVRSWPVCYYLGVGEHALCPSISCGRFSYALLNIYCFSKVVGKDSYP